MPQALPLLDNETPCATICSVQPSTLSASMKLSFQLLAKKGAALLSFLLEGYPSSGDVLSNYMPLFE